MKIDFFYKLEKKTFGVVLTGSNSDRTTELMVRVSRAKATGEHFGPKNLRSSCKLFTNL